MWYVFYFIFCRYCFENLGFIVFFFFSISLVTRWVLRVDVLDGGSVNLHKSFFVKVCVT